MNTKETYTKPQIEINEFKYANVITTSTDDNDRPWGTRSLDVDLFAGE